MVIIIFYSRIVPYKWLEDGAEADHPNEEPAVPKFLLSSLYNAMFYSAVVLFLLLKKCSPAGRENCGKREWGIFVRRSVFILPYDLKLSFTKKDPEPHSFFFFLRCFWSKLFPNLVSAGVALTSNYARGHRHRLRRMHTHTNTHTHSHAHTQTYTQTTVPSGVKSGCSTTPILPLWTHMPSHQHLWGKRNM